MYKYSVWDNLELSVHTQQMKHYIYSACYATCQKHKLLVWYRQTQWNPMYLTLLMVYANPKLSTSFALPFCVPLSTCVGFRRGFGGSRSTTGSSGWSGSTCATCISKSGKLSVLQWKTRIYDSLKPIGTYICQQSRPSLVKKWLCAWAAPSHYLRQCYRIMKNQLLIDNCFISSL